MGVGFVGVAAAEDGGGVAGAIVAVGGEEGARVARVRSMRARSAGKREGCSIQRSAMVPLAEEVERDSMREVCAEGSSAMREDWREARASSWRRMRQGPRRHEMEWSPWGRRVQRAWAVD